MFKFLVLLLSFDLLIVIITFVISESWQSGNAPDSKSGEPVIRRAGSNPVLSLIKHLQTFCLWVFFYLQKNSLITHLNLTLQSY